MDLDNSNFAAKTSDGKFLDISSVVVNNNTPIVKSDVLITLTDSQRTFLFCVYVIVVSIAFIGNLATIISTSRRKCRPLQKAFILSLAMSDLSLTILYGLVNIVTVSEKYSNWKLGSFMCHFIPYAQTFCLIANSLTLMSIGFDRYRNIVKSLHSRWNPKLCMAFVPIGAIWISSASIAYPITQWYNPYEIYVIMYDENEQPTHMELMLICQTTTDTKIDYKYYYMGIFAGIFIPLLLSFLWFYHKIALLVWKRRKPPGAGKNDKNLHNSSVTESTNTNQQVMHNPNAMANRPEVINASRITGSNQQPPENKNRNMQVERKIRTFRVILLLMAVFLVCRLPFWSMSLARLMVTINEEGATMALYCLSLLGLVNCALNPFLYTFLNETVSSISRTYKILCACFRKVCCFFCFNIDSQDLQKGPTRLSPGGDTTSPWVQQCNRTLSHNEQRYCDRVEEKGNIFSQSKFLDAPVLKMVLKNERRMSSNPNSIKGTYREIRY